MKSLNMFRLELLVQRNKVEEECKKLQALEDNELENTNFVWCPDSEYTMFTENFLHKQKR
jgi:hypothetical protein